MIKKLMIILALFAFQYAANAQKQTPNAPSTSVQSQPSRTCSFLEANRLQGQISIPGSTFRVLASGPAPLQVNARRWGSTTLEVSGSKIVARSRSRRGYQADFVSGTLYAFEDKLFVCE